MNIDLFQGAAFLGTGKEGSSILLLSIKPQECSFLLEMVPNDIWPPPPNLCYPQEEEATYLKQH